MKFIIIRFIEKQLEYYGPFETREKAVLYSEKIWTDHGCTVVGLQSVLGGCVKEKNVISNQLTNLRGNGPTLRPDNMDRDAWDHGWDTGVAEAQAAIRKEG